MREKPSDSPLSDDAWSVLCIMHAERSYEDRLTFSLRSIARNAFGELTDATAARTQAAIRELVALGFAEEQDLRATPGRN